MHPSLRARYRLPQDVDVAIAERMIAAAKKAGWSHAQVDGLLQFYATLAPALESGQVTPDAAIEQLYDFAELQGVATEKRAALMNWFTETGGYIEAHAGELPPLEAPAPAAIAAELEEIKKIQREDPERYWREETLQHRMHDLIEQGRGEVLPLATATPAHLARLSELQGMIGDYRSAYWAPATGAALQAEYRNILSLAPPDNRSGGGAEAAGDGGTGAVASAPAGAAE